MSQQTRHIPVPDWNKFHPWPPPGGLRHLIFNRKTNGFDACLIRIGRTLLVDEQAFMAWCAKHRMSEGGEA